MMSKSPNEKKPDVYLTEKWNELNNLVGQHVQTGCGPWISTPGQQVTAAENIQLRRYPTINLKSIVILYVFWKCLHLSHIFPTFEYIEVPPSYIHFIADRSGQAYIHIYRVNFGFQVKMCCFVAVTLPPFDLPPGLPCYLYTLADGTLHFRLALAT